MWRRRELTEGRVEEWSFGGCDTVMTLMVLMILTNEKPTKSRIGDGRDLLLKLVVEISKEMTGKRRHGMEKLHMGSGS